MPTFFLIIILFLSSHCYAQAADRTLSLRSYYDSTCKDYTGDWKGMIADPTDLFGDGGPWPVTIHLKTLGSKVTGETGAFMYAGKGGVMSKRIIHADCEKGVLKNICWGTKKTCDDYSQEGILASKNMLVLKLNYSNAMTGATFVAIASRDK